MKKLLSPLILASGVALMIAMSGCETAPVRHPRETKKVMLSADRANAEVAAEVITAVEFALPPGPQGSVGDAWEITSNNVKVLEQMGPMIPVPGDGVRAPLTLISFYALKPGRSVLRFVLVKPGEAEATPAAKCEVTVRVSD
jgi:hypothetical protein